MTLVQQSAAQEASSSLWRGQQGWLFSACPPWLHGIAPLVIFAADAGTGLAACAACIAPPFKTNENARIKASKAFCKRTSMGRVDQNRGRVSIALIVFAGLREEDCGPKRESGDEGLAFLPVTRHRAPDGATYLDSVNIFST